MSEGITKQMKRVEKFRNSREYFYCVENNKIEQNVEMLLKIQTIVNRIIFYNYKISWILNCKIYYFIASKICC